MGKETTYQDLKILISKIENKISSDELDCDDLFNQAWSIKNIPLEYRYKLYGLNINVFEKRGRFDEALSLCENYEKDIPPDSKNMAVFSDKEYHFMKILVMKGNIKEAIERALCSLPRMEKSREQAVKYNEAKMLYELGLAYFKLSDTVNAFKFLEQCNAVSLANNDILSQGNVCMSFAQIYNYEMKFKKAGEYAQKAIQFYTTLENNPKLALAYMAYGLMVEHTEDYAKSKEIYLKGLALVEEMNSTRLVAYFQIHLIGLYVKMEAFEEFETLTKELLKNSFLKQNKHFASNAYYKLANANLITKKYKEAKTHVDKLETIRLELGNLVSLRTLYLLKIDIYNGLEDHKTVNVTYQKLVDLNDKILNEANQKALKEFEAKYENEKKEREIQELKLESVSFQLQSLRAQMNPHFVFNTIASISQDLQPESIAKSQTLLESFARLMRANLDFAEEEKITLEDEIKFLKDYLLLEQNRLGDKLGFSIHCDEEIDQDFIEIPSMLIQPYIENAVKHGIMPLKKSGEIKVSFKEQNEQIICTIEDNGIGRKAAALRKKKSSAHMGKSTTINAKRLALLSPEIRKNLQVKYTDKVDETGQAMGTVVQISI